jgi:uncharacterized protein (DUF4415 family)
LWHTVGAKPKTVKCSKEDWKDAVQGRFYRPVKKQLTVRIDADVLEWLRSRGNGYQSRMNLALGHA